VCSLLDSDSALPLNAALGAHYPWQIAAGAALLASIVGARHTYLVTDMDAPAAWSAAMKRLRPAMRFHLASIRNDYPQPDPTLLLYTLLHRRLRPGRLPVEAGAIQIDAAAALAIGRMIYDDAPMLSVPLAARDRVRGVTHFLDVPIGAPVGGVLLSLGAPSDELIFRSGELLRDQRVGAEAIVAGGELIVDVSPRQFQMVPDPCIRCGWCVEMCPTRVEPAGVLEAAQRGDARMGEHYGIEACIECGICSFVCPSHLPLLEGIRILRRKEMMNAE
jgi:electron transport complex protein RnfC